MPIQDYADMVGRLVGFGYEELDPGTVEQAKWVLADTLLTAIYGIRSTAEVQNMVRAFGSESEDGSRNVPILGTPYFVAPEHSALIYGTAVVSHELDEGNQFAKGHPAAHILAPLLIAALASDSSGKEMIRAFVIGYEVAARLAYASNMRDDMHPHGTWGIVGGTIAAALLTNRSGEQTLRASLLAAALPLSTSWEAAVTGKTVRNLYTGFGSLNSYLAIQLESFGFESSLHVLDHVWGTILGSGINYALFQEQLMSPPLIEKNYFKMYPSCRFSHSAIDAAYELLANQPALPSQIERIEVHTYALAARMDNPAPDNPLAAKFSIPFLISAIVHQVDLVDCSLDSVLFDPSIRTFAEKVYVHEDPEMTALLPRKRPAEVKIVLKDGRTFAQRVDTASGAFDLPFPLKGLLSKYKKMASSDGEHEQSLDILNLTLQLEQYDTVRSWVRSMQEKLKA